MARLIKDGRQGEAKPGSLSPGQSGHGLVQLVMSGMSRTGWVAQGMVWQARRC